MVEIAAYLLIELFILLLFYWPGWVLLRIATVGRYPPAKFSPQNMLFVGTIGFFGVGIIALMLFVPGARG